ncbi:MAG: hypothetical protein IJT24_03895, partial [Lachnospiraceae bacterium]|nr:hypothetical protein [Lachnospiraceae bacterium]
AGEAMLTCRYSDMKYTSYVHVEDPAVLTDGILSGSKSKAYKYALTLKKGEGYAIVMPDVYQDVLWRSNKASKVFVDEYGRVSARGTGKATLTTRVNGRKLKINVTVTEP